MRDPYLLCKRNGEAISTEGMNTYMQTLKQHMEANELGEAYWNLHLIKAKGISDSDSKHIAGHKTAKPFHQRNERTHFIRF